MSTFLMRGHWGQLSGLHLDVVHNCCCLQWHWPWQCWHKASYVSGDEEVESTCRPMKAWLKKKKKDFIRFHFPWIYFKILFALSYNNVKVTLHKKRQWMWPISVLKALKITWQKASLYKLKNYRVATKFRYGSYLTRQNCSWGLFTFSVFSNTLSYQ